MTGEKGVIGGMPIEQMALEDVVNLIAGHHTVQNT